MNRLPAYLDGRDQWSSISLGLPSSRNETLLNINEKDRNAALIAVYNPGSFYQQTWKMVYGQTCLFCVLGQPCFLLTAAINLMSAAFAVNGFLANS